MRDILVIQHVRSEGLGTIGAALAEAGFKADFLKVFEGAKIPGDTQGYSALIVLGGPMGVYEENIYPFIKGELRLIESALREELPTLGICLGSQLLAKAAGAPVYRGKSKEIGWYTLRLTDEGLSDRLLIGLPGEFTVFQWHGDTFDVPPGAVNLAESKLFPNQMIRVGRRAYGVQFHLEVTEAMIREWISVNAEELKAVKGRIDPLEIIKDTPQNIPALHRHGSAVIKRFLRLIDL